MCRVTCCFHLNVTIDRLEYQFLTAMSESKEKLSDMTTEDLCDLLTITRKRVRAIEKVLNERSSPECWHDFVKRRLDSGTRDNGECYYVCSRCGLSS